jgi:hypothetical protein
MPRPRSIYEQKTASTLPPPELRERLHRVVDNELLLSVANKEYASSEYDPNRWRELGLANEVANPFTFNQDFLGKTIRIPGPGLPGFL